jgi:hypothetical protein
MHHFSSCLHVNHSFRIAAFVAAAGLTVSSCQIFGQGEPEAANVLIRGGCAPNDAPVLEIYITDQELTCSAVPQMRPAGEPQRTSFIFIQVLLSPPAGEPGSTVTLDGHEGWAYSCTRGGDCEAATNGVVTFGTTDSGRQTINIEMDFPRKGDVSGRFQALLCQREYFCG